MQSQSLVSFFTVPKAFKGEIGRIQRTAIGSWRKLHPDCELFLCGAESGIEHAAVESGAVVVDNIERNEYGTPLLSSAFARVAGLARHRCLVYLNADIMLVDDLLSLTGQIRFSRFLAVSHRYNLPSSESVSLEGDDWRERAKHTVLKEGELGPASQCDLFLFPNEPAFTHIPPFAVGRPGWDNWFIFNAYRRRIPIVDCSDRLTLIHQYHDYAHVPESQNEKWVGPEGDRNYRLAGGWHNIFTMEDATHALSITGLHGLRDRVHVQRRVERLGQFRPRLFKCLRAWKLRTALCRLFPKL